MSGPFGSTPHNLFNTTSTTFYNGVVEQSLRFDDGSNPYLYRTPSSQGNLTTFTFSCWVKRGNLGSYQELFHEYPGSGERSQILFMDDDTLKVELEAANVNHFRTNRVFRDVSSWYNIVVAYNSGDSTSTNRVKIYVNGIDEANVGGFSTANYPSQDAASGFNRTNQHEISTYDASDYHIDGYLAEVNFIDGQALTPSSFGESKDGIWIPKNTSGLTFGTNGFRLQFKQTGTGTASASTIGADTSGQGNHWTSSGLAATDSNMPDCPENNFAVMNPLTIGDGRVASGVVQSEGNLKVACNGFSTSIIGGTYSTMSIPKDKKIYCEVYEPNQDANLWGAGVIIDNHVQNNTQLVGNGAIAYYNRSIYQNGVENDYGSGGGALGGLGVSKLTAGDVLGIAVDGATGKVWFHRNGTYFGEPQGHQNGAGTTGNPSAGTNEIGTINNTAAINPSGEIFIFVTGNSSVDDLYVNFGQDSTFSGNKTAGTNTDAEGRGLFLYPVPTDYLALCSANLTDPEIGPNQTEQADDNFNTVLWTGNNSAPRNITGVGFSPDWIWVKDRVAANNNVLVDTVRGISELLYSNSTSAGVTGASQVSAVGADGFTIGSNTYMNENGSSNTYVGWNWKAGTAFSNDASATGVGTIDSTGQVNTAAGFSIISYTGNGSSSQTVAHGLSSTPEVVFLKDRDTNSNNNQWQAYHAGAGDDYGYLSTSAAFTGAAQIIPSGTTTIELKAHLATTNESGDNYIMYCFHSVEGYSKIGTYTGNNNSDGPYIYMGFRPAWVLFKGDTVASNWLILDNKRSPFNLADDVIQANESNAEATNLSDVDFLSNGIKIRDVVSNDTNKAHTYLYMAFAEAPFKYANAR
tara:strand:+ start:2105 stop:4684 length:2580 start_codon:yes stop_codon:yes gene_type:complete